jgi:hypothetical protein
MLTGWLCAEKIPNLLILYNKKVPSGKDLVYDYIEHHGLSTNVMLGLDLSTRESISIEDYKSCFEQQLSRRFEENRPDVILTVYGLPLWVEDDERLRAFDQLLVLGEGAMKLDERLILNPLLQNPKSEFSSHLVKVARLDGPSLKQAKVVLSQWKKMHRMGCWRRFGLSGIDKDLPQLMKQRGFWVEEKPALNLMPLNELQFLNCHQGQVRELLELHAKEVLAPGSMILRYHSSSFRDGDFRSLGESDASAASMMGASFYVGAQKTQRPEEDLFDPLLFFLKFSKGDSFVDAAYHAMPNLAGSLLLIGDPLARPYAAPSIERQRQFFERNQLKDPSVEELKEFNLAKDWWLMREYFEMWNEGKIDLVLANLKMAIIKRRSPLFFERLSHCYKQLGRQEEMKPWLGKWPKQNRSPWEKHVLELLGY